MGVGLESLWPAQRRDQRRQDHPYPDRIGDQLVRHSRGLVSHCSSQGKPSADSYADALTDSNALSYSCGYPNFNTHTHVHACAVYPNPYTHSQHMGRS
jgi:hypothetical protein